MNKKIAFFGVLILVFSVYFFMSVYYYLSNDYDFSINNISSIDNINYEDEFLPIGYYDNSLDIELWGYVNNDGDVVIEPQWEYVYFFDENNLAIVCENECSKYGLINKKGDYILPTEYSNIEYKGSSIYYFKDDTGEFISSYYNNNINEIKSISFDEIGYFNDGLAYVVKSNKVGFIDTNGNIVIELKYDKVPQYFNYSFRDGYAFIYEFGEFGIINKIGEYVVYPSMDDVINEYQSLLYFSDDYYTLDKVLFKEDNKWGYIKNDGTIIIEPRFIEAYPFFDNNIAAVSISGEKYSFINVNGDLLTPEKYISVSDFYNGYAFVSIDEGKTGLIDENGNEVINLDNDYVGFVTNNIILVEDEGKSYFKNMLTGKKYDIDYYYSEDYTECQVAFVSNDKGEEKVLSIIDKNFEDVYSEVDVYQYKQIQYKNKYYILILAYEKNLDLEYYTIIDETGKIIWKPYK